MGTHHSCSEGVCRLTLWPAAGVQTSYMWRSALAKSGRGGALNSTARRWLAFRDIVLTPRGACT
jgi:hypothetical protein